MFHFRTGIFLLLLTWISGSAAALPEKPRLIPQHEWEAIAPLLLPDTHPAREKLDKIFAKQGITKDAKAFTKAGFRCLPLRTLSNALIARHDKLKGYLVKIYLDNQPVSHEWNQWSKRIRGAERIRNLIDARGYGSQFKAPKKWIYLIPQPSLRTALLLVEDMDLLPYETNLKLWKKAPTPELLDAFYDLVHSLGLCDSVFADNAPFARDKKIAFVDTEHSLVWPIPYGKLNGRLSPSMEAYWKALTGQ